MPDFTRVVEFLRDIRQGPLQSVNDEITQLAADYAQLCVQANERLRQCSAFLQQGLRTEAIHLADESPNLLDFVAALDLPDQQAWAEFCQNNGLAVPPPLQLERAGQLNEAYAQDQPLEHLMAHHRLLALSRSPIRQRLDTLRKIAEVDTAGSGAWEKDIRIFEKARLKELPSAFHRAVKSHDNGTITNLMDEIGKQNWYEAVPADLVSAVTDAFSRVQKAGVEAQLQKLVEPLRDAYAARSLQECQALVQRWKNIMSTGGVTQVSSELTDEIRPVVAFVNEQIKREDYLKRFRDSCKAFTRMLDDDAPDAQLEAGFAKLRDFKEEIPDDITRRYAAKKTGRRQTIERSHKVRLVTIASLAAAVIVVVLVVIKLMQSSGAARAVAQTIDGDLVQHSQAGLSAAERYVDGLQKSNPGILKEPNVGAAVARMQTQRGDFDSNTRTLELQLKSGDEALAAAAPVMANRTAPITEVASAATLAQKSFNDLSAATAQLAWVDSDNRLPAMTTNLKAALDSLKERANSAATSELEKLAADLQAIPQNASTPEAVGDAHNRINALRDRLTAIRNIPLLTDDTTKVLAALAQQITDRESGAVASGTVAAELQNIRTHAASAADLQLALESFVSRFPKDPRAADFKTALARLPFAAGLDSWLQMAAGFAKNSPDTVAAAQKRVDAITAFLTANPSLPLTAAANTYVDYLKHFIDAHAEKGVWQTTFTDLLASPLLAELNFMEISDGRRYYTLGPINRVEHRINNEVSVSFDVLNPKDLTKRTTITIDPPATVPAEPEPAPHTKVVADIAQSLKEINSGNWDTFGIELADSLAKNDLIDPVVKAILLQAAIKGEKDVTTWGGTSPVESDYAGALSRWESQKLGDLAWYDPNKISDTTRKNLKAIVDNLPPSAAEIPKITAAKAAIIKALTLTIAGTGVLLKDDNGAWGLSCAIAPQDGDSLIIIQPAADASTPATLQSIGSITGGKAALDAPALRDVPQGTLFYLIREHP